MIHWLTYCKSLIHRCRTLKYGGVTGVLRSCYGCYSEEASSAYGLAHYWVTADWLLWRILSLNWWKWRWGVAYEDITELGHAWLRWAEFNPIATKKMIPSIIKVQNYENFTLFMFRTIRASYWLYSGLWELHISYIIIIIIIIKRVRQYRAEREWYTPYQSEDPAPQYHL